MNIYLLTQEENMGYDTYDSMVVVAENEEQTKRISPSDYYKYNEELGIFHWNVGGQYNEEDIICSWATRIENIKVQSVGVANKELKEGVVCSSFNAG